MDKLQVLGEIKGFLEGYNTDFKYLVNVETNPSSNIAECVIHEPNKEKRIVKMRYEPFMFIKDLSRMGHNLYDGHSLEYVRSKEIKHGITITKLQTGNQKRLVDGYCYKVTSSKSYNDIISFFRDGGVNPYEKQLDINGNVMKDAKGDNIFPFRDLFYAPRTTEQFLIANQIRLYKGYELYKDVHKVTFDIETRGLRFEIARMFAIGIRDNRGFETILEVEKPDDDESEIRLIQDFFNLIHHLAPAVISGYNSEEFDFNYILGRAKILKMDLTQLPTSLNKDIPLKRRPNTSVKYGNTADKYTATEMWGISVIDILHAAKKTASINSDIKSTRLKYIAKHEKIAKQNRTYIKGEDNSIGRYYLENKIFTIAEDNTYIQIPDIHQETGKKLYVLQGNKDRINEESYKKIRTKYLSENPEFVEWFRGTALPKQMTKFINGKKLVKQYLLDDLWETEQVDETYNQSSFMLAKIVPTTYQRICTMGTASIWNLLLTAWSYENDLAIPVPDVNENFSGGLARCYKVGYTERIKKIDYASLYPMIQLSDDVFPIFDITGVIKKMLLYLTTTRNIYKKLANSDDLNNEEVNLLKEIDHEVYHKYVNKLITSEDKALFKIKQLPIKILNNSLFGALGSAISFNWSDNLCAARITCSGRLHLRHAIDFFSKYGCIALLAVTDGINFHYPLTTTITISDNGVTEGTVEGSINDMWNYCGKTGMDALIHKFNTEEMKSSFMSVDDDGDAISSLNLSRINYANLTVSKDKKTGEMKEKIKLTGNTIKSKTMPEYIEEFIDTGLDLILHGKGKEFVEYYYDYCDNLRYMQIPLKKIASKSKVKITLSSYKKRGKDKNGREKGMQAHMELLLEQRNNLAEKLFEEHIDEFDLSKIKRKITSEDKLRFVSNYMPPEPELDSLVYYVNSGYRKSHGDSRRLIDKETGVERFAATLISNKDLEDNPDIKGVYNYEKYLDAFNKRVESILVGFTPEVRKKILVKITKTGDLKKEMFTSDELVLTNFDSDDYDKSMYLEEKEVEFWNKYGYDPRKTWDGFKTTEDDRIYYEIYEHALKHLNDKMVESGKKLIKRVDDKYEVNDLILIKNGSEYHVGLYNGTYIRIIKENVDIPKSEIELILDKKREEDERKLSELRTSELAIKTEKEIYMESEEYKGKLREELFVKFAKKYGIDIEIKADDFFAEVPDALSVFEDFVLKSEGNSTSSDEIEEEYVDYSDEVDGAY